MELKHWQRNWLTATFETQPGYILNFSDRTFAEFFEDHFQVDIYDDRFAKSGKSKAKRFMAFIALSPPRVVAELVQELWDLKHADQIEKIERELQLASLNGDPEYADILANAYAIECEELEKFLESLKEGQEHASTASLRHLASVWTFDTVEAEIDRALANVDTDPEDALTAARAVLESVFKSILFECDLPLPKKKSEMNAYYKAVREPLGLSPGKADISDDIANDVRTILSALGSVVDGIGSLRTHGGDAHGKRAGTKRVDARIARLAVNASSVLCLFLIETWQKKYPDHKLRVRDGQSDD
ncbi:abortive infection family protein [Paracoccaceae bacterium GXU_MW_L88]